MKNSILIVEDESSIAFNIEYMLKQEGFCPTSCTTCEEARTQLATGRFSLMILDVGLPDGNGFDLCREIRKTSTIPIIILTARADEIDRIVGLEIGADDYVTKPFSPRELAARVKSVLRRIEGRIIEPLSAKSETPFVIDENRFTVSYFSTELQLSRYEFLILKTLFAHPGWVYSREKLMNLVWDDPSMSTDRTVDAHIKSIRAKLRTVRDNVDPIKTHRGLGYSLVDQW